MEDRIVAKGKTKTLSLRTPAPGARLVAHVANHDDLTAGDGARKDSFPRKGEYSVQTNHYVMDLLRRCKIPLAYLERSGPTTFRTLFCKMLPYEVVAVRFATAKSSILKRRPELSVGHRFEVPEVCFFLKTTGRRFGHIELEKDDSYITSFGKGGVVVRRPDVPLTDDTQRVMHIPAELLFEGGDMHPFQLMSTIVRHVFVIIEKAWAEQQCTLCDLKIEFGFVPEGDLVVADVIDNDSWRLLSSYGVHLDKQPFRDGDTSLAVIAERYREVAERIMHFVKIDPRDIPM